MIHNWQTSSNVILKSLILSSALFSIFEVFILNNMYGGILSTIYQLVAEFAFGLMCGLFYLRSVNIIVSIFFGFIETFCAVILTHIAPLFGNGIINIIFFLLFIYLVLKITLRPQNIKQIEKILNLIDYNKTSVRRRNLNVTFNLGPNYWAVIGAIAGWLTNGGFNELDCEYHCRFDWFRAWRTSPRFWGPVIAEWQLSRQSLGLSFLS